MKTKNRPLAWSMRKILTGYAVNFNKRHRRHGHLFQNRYKSIVCQEDAYLKELVRYIHLNLLRAQVVKSLSALHRCPWSGHSVLMGQVTRGWQDREHVLSYFGSGRVGRKNYQQYVEEGIELGRRPQLVGGLVRSVGGWSEVLELRKKKGKHAFDSRILGDSKFIGEIKSELDDLVKKNLRLSGQQIDIQELSKRVCKKHGISLSELCSGSRRREIVDARRVISWIGVCELGYPGAEVVK